MNDIPLSSFTHKEHSTVFPSISNPKLQIARRYGETPEFTDTDEFPWITSGRIRIDASIVKPLRSYRGTGISDLSINIILL